MNGLAGFIIKRAVFKLSIKVAKNSQSISAFTFHVAFFCTKNDSPVYDIQLERYIITSVNWYLKLRKGGKLICG